MNSKMDMKEIRKKTGLSLRKFAEKYGTPFSTITNWELGERVPPEYVLDLLNFKVEAEKIRPMGYVFIDMTEEEQTWAIFPTEAEAVGYAEKKWDEKTKGQKLVYKVDPSAVFSVAFLPLEWDGDKFIPMLKGEVEEIWSV